MPDKIEIEKVAGVYNFFNTSYYPELCEEDLVHCSKAWCETVLSKAYVYILRKLKEAKLLPENYSLLCCNCYEIFNYWRFKKEIAKRNIR